MVLEFGALWMELVLIYSRDVRIRFFKILVRF